jgi:hypothetical protein
VFSAVSVYYTRVGSGRSGGCFGEFLSRQHFFTMEWRRLIVPVLLLFSAGEKNVVVEFNSQCLFPQHQVCGVSALRLLRGKKKRNSAPSNHDDDSDQGVAEGPMQGPSLAHGEADFHGPALPSGALTASDDEQEDLEVLAGKKKKKKKSRKSKSKKKKRSKSASAAEDESWDDNENDDENVVAQDAEETGAPAAGQPPQAPQDADHTPNSEESEVMSQGIQVYCVTFFGCVLFFFLGIFALLCWSSKTCRGSERVPEDDLLDFDSDSDDETDSEALFQQLGVGDDLDDSILLQAAIQQQVTARNNKVIAASALRRAR